MKKKLALDLDGVVFDSENLYRVYTEMYDVDVKKGNNIINNSERTFQKRYNWDENEFSASNNNIHALYFKNNASDKLEENEYIKNVNNWGEVYKYLITKENLIDKE